MKTMTFSSENIIEHDFSNAIRGSQKQKYFLNIAGEFFVAAELNRRGICASVTYGAAKNADVLVFDPETQQTAVIEVKTTAAPNSRWLTGAHSLDQNNIRPHLFWVLTLLPAENEVSDAPRYFVLSSHELIENLSRHRQGDQGACSLSVKEAEAMQCEGQWTKITDWLGRK